MKIVNFIFVLILFPVLTLLIVGCGQNTVNVNLKDKCEATSLNLVETFYDKESLEEPTEDNFFVEITSNEEQNLSAITINDVIYKKDMKVKFSVGNNNFLEENVWKLEENKLFVALPTLYVEARGGITKIEAGTKIYMVRVFDNFGSITVGEVGAYGIIEGSNAEKTTDSSGKLVVSHTRESGKSFVGWELLKEGEPIEEGKTIYTKKLYEKEKVISYGIDVTVDSSVKGYSSGLYNYYVNGEISNPLNRTIDYTISIPGVGNTNFEINFTEKTPAQN